MRVVEKSQEAKTRMMDISAVNTDIFLVLIKMSKMERQLVYKIVTIDL